MVVVAIAVHSSGPELRGQNLEASGARVVVVVVVVVVAVVVVVVVVVVDVVVVGSST